MNNFEMPVMEIVSFSADDIIRTSDGTPTGFKYGRDASVKVSKSLMGDDGLTTQWSEFIDAKMKMEL